MTIEDDAAKLDTRPKGLTDGIAAANFHADFFHRLKERGLSNEQAFTLTHEHMVLSMTTEVPEDDG